MPAAAPQGGEAARAVRCGWEEGAAATANRLPMTRLLVCAGVLALLSCAPATAAPVGGGLAVPDAAPLAGGAVQDGPAPAAPDAVPAPAVSTPAAAGVAGEALPAQVGDPPPSEPGDGNGEPAPDDDDVGIVVPLPPDPAPPPAPATEPPAAASPGGGLPITGFDALIVALVGASLLAFGHAARTAARRPAARAALADGRVRRDR